jgi:hypothetical protein
MHFRVQKMGKLQPHLDTNMGPAEGRFAHGRSREGERPRWEGERPHWEGERPREPQTSLIMPGV